MTIQDRVKAALTKKDTVWGEKEDNIDKLIAIAYHMGYEKATKRTSDAYAKLLSEQIERANKCRYHKMAMEVQGNKDHIYMPSYGGDVTDVFSDDNTNL